MDVTLPHAQLPTLRVAVGADFQLVTDAVAAAIADAGFDVTRIVWTSDGTTDPSLDVVHPDVTVLVFQNANSRAVEIMRALHATYATPTLVVADRPGSWWGGFLEAGAEAVLSPAAPIDVLLEAARAVAAGYQVIGVVEKLTLVRQWLATQADHRLRRERLAMLTPREREVLEHLHRGDPAAVIAHDLGVSEATVRSQIRGVMVKLQVRTQLAAVAAFEDAVADDIVDGPQTGEDLGGRGERDG